MSSERSGKIGDGTFKAMARLGLNELRAALVHPASNIAQPLEHGMYGVPTHSEVAKQRDSAVSDRVNSSQARTMDAERNEPEFERGL